MKMILALPLLLVLGACGNKVDCNSDYAKQNVLDIADSNSRTAAWFRQMERGVTDKKLSRVKTVEANSKLKQATCEATYSFSYKGKPYEVPMRYELAQLEDTGEIEVRAYVDTVKSAFMAAAMSQGAPN